MRRQKSKQRILIRRKMGKPVFFTLTHCQKKLRGLSNQYNYKSNMHGLLFIGTKFSNVKYQASIMTECNFRDSFLTGVDFFNSNMKGVSFKNATLKNVVFYNCNLKGANFSGAKFEQVEIGQCCFLDGGLAAIGPAQRFHPALPFQHGFRERVHINDCRVEIIPKVMPVLHHALDGTVVGFNPGLFRGILQRHPGEVILVKLPDFFCCGLINHSLSFSYPVAEWCMAHLFTNPFFERQPAFQNEADLLAGNHPDAVNEFCKKQIVKLGQHASPFCKMEQFFCFHHL